MYRDKILCFVFLYLLNGRKQAEQPTDNRGPTTRIFSLYISMSFEKSRGSELTTVEDESMFILLYTVVELYIITFVLMHARINNNNNDYDVIHSTRRYTLYSRCVS